jgi:hypothetical protein
MMGAGMCNTLFSSAGTKLFYIGPEGWLEPFFWTLANSLGHEYHVFYTCTTEIYAESERNAIVLEPKDFLRFYLASNPVGQSPPASDDFDCL